MKRAPFFFSREMKFCFDHGDRWYKNGFNKNEINEEKRAVFSKRLMLNVTADGSNRNGDEDFVTIICVTHCLAR